MAFVIKLTVLFGLGVLISGFDGKFREEGGFLPKTKHTLWMSITDTDFLHVVFYIYWMLIIVTCVGFLLLTDSVYGWYLCAFGAGAAVNIIRFIYIDYFLY